MLLAQKQEGLRPVSRTSKLLCMLLYCANIDIVESRNDIFLNDKKKFYWKKVSIILVVVKTVTFENICLTTENLV
jgi:hypothetical protein